MAMKIKLDDQLVKHAQAYAVMENRSIAKQIEHWARVGRVMEDNPDLSYGFIQGALVATKEVEVGKGEHYVRRIKTNNLK